MVKTAIKRPYKENIWLEKEIGEYDDVKCYLKCFLNFHGPPGNPSASSVGMHDGVVKWEDQRGVDKTVFSELIKV
jgi:hypothetical protein